MELFVPFLLTVISFLLGNLYLDLKKIGKNVEQLMINEAADRERQKQLEKRIDNLELQTYGKG